jgi:hypothetical protein
VQFLWKCNEKNQWYQEWAYAPTKM